MLTPKPLRLPEIFSLDLKVPICMHKQIFKLCLLIIFQSNLFRKIVSNIFCQTQKIVRVQKCPGPIQFKTFLPTSQALASHPGTQKVVFLESKGPKTDSVSKIQSFFMSNFDLQSSKFGSFWINFVSFHANLN